MGKELIGQYLNLSNLCYFLEKNTVEFSFLNSYNGDKHKKLFCNHILKFQLENDIFIEDFPFFIIDVFMQKLDSKQKEFRKYYGFFSDDFMDMKNGRYYLINMIGSDICIDILCENFEWKYW